MERTIYLIDNMVVCSRALAPFIESDFLKENVWIIDEVVHEAARSRSIDSIKKLRHGLEAKECVRLKKIARACVENYKILNLYEGCADALMLATALAINDSDDEQAQMQFERIKPIIVTEERGIQTACESLNIEWLSQAGFVYLIKQVSNQELPLSYG